MGIDLAPLYGDHARDTGLLNVRRQYDLFPLGRLIGRFGKGKNEKHLEVFGTHMLTAKRNGVSFFL